MTQERDGSCVQHFEPEAITSPNSTIIEAQQSSAERTPEVALTYDGGDEGSPSSKNALKQSSDTVSQISAVTPLDLTSQDVQMEPLSQNAAESAPSTPQQPTGSSDVGYSASSPIPPIRKFPLRTGLIES